MTNTHFVKSTLLKAVSMLKTDSFVFPQQVMGSILALVSNSLFVQEACSPHATMGSLWVHELNCP